MLADLAINEYLARTASGDPLPGGGSAAALTAALAAALIEMVANLTIGRKKFEGVDAEMRALALKAAELRAAAVQEIDRDVEAYTQVLAAFQLPKTTDGEKARRGRAVEEAFKQAALVPLSVARKAAALMALGRTVIVKGNPNAASDAAAGVLAARMAACTAVYNVRINLGSIRDAAFIAELAHEAERLEAEAESQEKEILALVKL
ncbi:MAG: cyclodeaminase/cyclohydrolase family protein [Rhodobacteraceae bacterium]|nr:cyclodeaminase/cyclohydrolase family protein [Paracoccaceae bacterium]